MSVQSSWALSGELGADYEQFLAPAMFRPWAPVLADFAEVAIDERVLDIACGTGVVAREIFERFGQKDRIVGCDNNRAMLSAAEQAAPDVSWRLGDALDLPFDASVFDVALCQQGFQFFPDRQKAAREAHRVVRSGGRFALAVWASLKHQPGQSAVAAAVETHVGSEAARLVASPFVLGNPAMIAADLNAAGFKNVEERQETRLARFPSALEFTLGMVRGGSLARAGVVIDERTEQAILKSVAAALEPYQSDEELAFPMVSNLLLARK